MAVGLTIGLFFGILVLGGLLVSAFIPLSFLLTISAALATAQLYLVPAGGFKLPLAVVAAYGLWRFARLEYLITVPWLAAALLLVLVQSFSAIWSPDPLLAFRLIIYTLPFVWISMAMLGAAEHEQRYVKFAVKLALGFTVIQAILVVAFRLSPTLEVTFITSSFFKVFSPGNAAAGAFEGSYTILDPIKSGGLFLNANVAAAYLGVSGLAALAFGRFFEDRRLYAVAAINLFAVPFAGSKGAILIWSVLLALLSAAYVKRRGGLGLKGVVVACFAFLLAVSMAFVGYLHIENSPLIENSVATFESRFPMWGFAWNVLLERPLTGLGFGGWEIEWPSYALANGLNIQFPPHNSLLNYFVQSGVFAAVLAVVFAFAVMFECVQACRSGDQKIKDAGWLMMMACAWLFGQSLAENYGFIGEPHFTVLLAVMLAALRIYRSAALSSRSYGF